MTDYRTVPVEPTEEMIQAGVKAAQRAEMTCVSWPEMASFTYRAMLAAAPALSASPAPAGDLVERVALIIDPQAFDHPTVHPQHLTARRKGALAKARVLIAAMQPGSDND